MTNQRIVSISCCQEYGRIDAQVKYEKKVHGALRQIEGYGQVIRPEILAGTTAKSAL